MENYESSSKKYATFSSALDSSTASSESHSNFSLLQSPNIDVPFPYSLSTYKYTNSNPNNSYEMCNSVNMMSISGESTFSFSLSCSISILLIADVSKGLGNGAKTVFEKFQKENPSVRVNIGKTWEDFVQNNEKESITRDAEIIVYTPGPPVDVIEKALEHCPQIKWLHSWFAGVDKIVSLLQTNSKLKDILVTNGRGAFSRALAEYAMCMMLYFEKQVSKLIENRKSKVWDAFVTGRLGGKTVGFIGYGDIGKTVAQMCKVFHMKCIALRRSKKNKIDDGFLDEVYDCQDTEEMHQVYSKSDFVVCSLPLTEATRKSIGKNEFEKMKKSAVFISIGRGEVIDEEGLVYALKNHLIKGAALDVFAIEPLPADSELWNLENVIITPHNADYTDDYHDRALYIFLVNLWKFIKGEKNVAQELMHTPVDKVNGY